MHWFFKRDLQSIWIYYDIFFSINRLKSPWNLNMFLKFAYYTAFKKRVYITCGISDKISTVYIKIWNLFSTHDPWSDFSQILHWTVNFSRINLQGQKAAFCYCCCSSSYSPFVFIWVLHRINYFKNMILVFEKKLNNSDY